MTSARFSSSQLHELDQVESTQDEARRLLALEPHPLHSAWVLARHQSQGRGRQGRTWIATEDSLILSAAFRLTKPAIRKPLVSLWAGSALFEALRELTGDCAGVFLKWPNDLVVSQSDGLAKIGGILAEARGAENVVVGWGVNLESSPRDPLFRASSLKEAGLFPSGAPSPRTLANALRSQFLRALDDWESRGEVAERTLLEDLRTGPMKPLWGKRGVLVSGFSATALSLDDSGALSVQLEEGPEAGQIVSVSAGEFRFEGT